MEWQPIETAPIDGSIFLGWWPDSIGWIDNDANACAVSTWFIFDKFENPFESPRKFGEDGAPTHWMPLPDPPQ